MGFDLDEMVKSKEALRRKLADRPIAEKLRLAEELTERALAIRPDTSPSPSDAPWPIPSHWRWKKMADVATVVGGSTPATDHKEYFGGDIPWITPADLSKYTNKTISRGARNITRAGLDNSGARLLPAGTVLFSSRAPIGYVAIATNPVATNQGFKSFVLRDEVTPEFVYYYLQHARDLARSLASGTTFLEISGKKAEQIPIPVPPLDEQQHIVAEIEKQFTRLDAGVASLKRVQTALKRYRASMLKAACEGRLVPTEAELARKENRTYETGEQLLQRILKERRENWNGKGKYRELIAPDITKLPPAPEGWVWATISQLTSDSMIGLDRGRAQQSADSDVGVPYIKMNNVTMDGRVTFDKISYVPATPDERNRFVVREDDVLFNTRNSKELVGKVGLVRNPPLNAIYNNNLMRIRLSGGVLPAFLNLQMTSHEFRRRMELVKKATTNVAAVYAKDLFPLPIALPPFAEQTRIVSEVERRLSVIEEAEAVVNANCKRASRLRQSVLQKAFNGK
jgi:type I restriction enzyme S subunit